MILSDPDMSSDDESKGGRKAMGPHIQFFAPTVTDVPTPGY